MKYKRTLPRNKRCPKHYKGINQRWAHCRLRLGHEGNHEFPKD